MVSRKDHHRIDTSQDTRDLAVLIVRHFKVVAVVPMDFFAPS